jgi:hypothetical protein
MSPTRMTRKQALAALYRLRNTYLDLVYQQDHVTFEASRAMRDESFDALLVLVDAIHGTCKPGETLFLCQVCHLRRGHWRARGGERTSDLLWICAPCQAAHVKAADDEAEHTTKLARMRNEDGASFEEKGTSQESGSPHPYSSRELASRQVQGGKAWSQEPPNTP